MVIRIFILTLLSFISLMYTAFATPNYDSTGLPNDIYTVLYSSLGQETLSQPASILTFGEIQTNQIENIIKNEFPIPLKRVARGKVENYRFTQAYYDKFWMVYVTGNAGEWKEKLVKISFSHNFKSQQLQEKETDVFLKLNQMYGIYTTVSKFFYEEGKFNPKLNYYFWEKDNVIISYRCVNNERNSIIVVEIWDKNYFKQNNIHAKYQVLQN